MTQEFYDTNSFAVMQESEWLTLVNNLYCSQENGLSLLLNKRIRKTEEHALHDSTNTIDST